MQRDFLNLTALNSAANITGDAVDLRHYNGFCIQVVTTGTGTATLTMEETCYPVHDPRGGAVAGNFKQQPTTDATWTTNAAVNTLLTKPADGSAGSISIHVSDFRAGWIRFKLASASGTFTVKVFLVAKGEG